MQRIRTLEAAFMTTLDETRFFSPLDPGADRLPAKVTLVGGGPGDPDLLTLKAARALAEARLVLYDKLVSKEVLKLVNPQADLIYVGKQSGQHVLTQEGIIELMVRLASSGRSVVRLKGGDPYIFGRGGEEAQALAAAGIAFEVIPGISAAQGAAASLGLSLTERRIARRLQYLTGHGEDGRLPRDINWPAIADPLATTVVYMPRHTLAEFVAGALANGLAAGTPAAAIINATRTDERIIDATIGLLNRVPLLVRALNRRLLLSCLAVTTHIHGAALAASRSLRAASRSAASFLARSVACA